LNSPTTEVRRRVRRRGMSALHDGNQDRPPRLQCCVLTQVVRYFELSLSFVLFSHSECMTSLFSSRTSTREESMISIVSTSSRRSSITLSCLGLGSLVASQVTFLRQIRHHCRPSILRVWGSILGTLCNRSGWLRESRCLLLSLLCLLLG